VMPSARGLYSLLMAVALVACSVPANRHVSDRAPPDIDPSAVPDAIPEADTITRAGNSSPYTVNGQSYWVLASARGYRERGIASWYGLKFHGRPTANGERFSVYGPTAAHRSLPIPTYVRVTNEGNGASMVLRVNDRGPFHSDRLIDLSYGAAVRLGFADQGTASVLVEAIDVPGMQDVRSDAANGYSRLQLGAFSTRSAAEALAQRARAVVSGSVTVAAAGDAQTPLFRVRAGPFADAMALEDARTRLRAAGLPEGQPIP
jgi:rare lipoprotein A